MPEPASRIRRCPWPSSIVTQGVFPPYRTVRGPGVGIDPRVPQNRIESGTLPPPGGRSKLIGILDDNFLPVHDDDPPNREASHRSGHGFPAGTDHLSNGGVGHFPGNPVATFFAGHAEEEMGDPTVDVEQGEARDSLIGPAKPAGEFSEHGDRQIGRGSKPAPKIIPAQLPQTGIRHGDDVRRAGFVIEEGHFAEEPALGQHGQDDFAAIFSEHGDLDLSVGDEEKGIAGVALGHDHGALGQHALSEQAGQRQEFLFAEMAEERDRLEEVRARDGHRSSIGYGGWARKPTMEFRRSSGSRAGHADQAYSGTMRPFFAMIWLMLGVGISAAAAQSSPVEQALGRLKTGDRLKVEVPGAVWVGAYQRFGVGELLVARDSAVERLALDRVTGLWVRGRATKIGAIVGAVAGVGAGAFLGLIVASVCDSYCPSQAAGLAAGGLLGGAAGLGLGAIVGAAIPRWKRIFR